jgi:hypothetical protein
MSSSLIKKRGKVNDMMNYTFYIILLSMIKINKPCMFDIINLYIDMSREKIFYID